MTEAADRHPVFKELEAEPNPIARLAILSQYGFEVVREHYFHPEMVEEELPAFLETEQFKRKYQAVQEARVKAQKDAATRIYVNDRSLHDMTESALKAIKIANVPARLFIRAGQVVRVVTDEDGRPAIEALDEYAVRHELDRCASWLRSTKVDAIYIPPPMDVVRDLIRTPSIDLPALRGVVEVPTLRPDGSVLDHAGYDKPTGLYYCPAPGIQIPRVPDSPTADQVAAARDLLLEVIKDFPFVDQASRANTIAALVTAVIRPLINAPVPMALLDKPTQGTGASLIAEVIAEVVIGADAPMMTAPEDEAEWRKQILAILRAGHPVMIVDNVEGKLRSAALASLLTAMSHQDRILGKSEDLKLPHRCTWLATGINIQLGGDLPRRCYYVRLDANVARPWQRDQKFTHPDLKAWVREMRGAILFAVLVLARAWVAAGRPVPQCLSKVGGFDAWTETIGGILYHARIHGFLDNLADLYDEADEDGPQWEIFLERWWEIWKDKPISIARMIEYMRTESSSIPVDQQLLSAVPSDLAEHWSRQGSIFAARLGHALRHRNLRPFSNGLRIVRAKKSQKGALWSLQKVNP